MTSAASICTDHRGERGTASIEAVLVLPILLVIFLLVDHSARSMMLKHDVSVQARTKAWNHAYNETCTGYRNTSFGRGRLSLATPCSDDRQRGPEGRENFGETVMREMQNRAESGSGTSDLLPGKGAGGSANEKLTRDVKQALKPLSVQAGHAEDYPRWWRLPITARTRHAVSPVGMPALYWNVLSDDPSDQVLQLAYDPVLQQKLRGGLFGFGEDHFRRSDYLFKRLFPELPVGR